MHFNLFSTAIFFPSFVGQTVKGIKGESDDVNSQMGRQGGLPVVVCFVIFGGEQVSWNRKNSKKINLPATPSGE